MEYEQIAICGLAGTGKSALMKELKANLKWESLSGGDVFRQIAIERQIKASVQEVEAKDNPEVDEEIETRIEQFRKANRFCIVESRLAPLRIKEGLNILLYCTDEKTRIKRIANRYNISLKQAEDDTERRERAMRIRCEKYTLNLDEFYASDIFQLRFNTSKISFEEELDRIYRELKFDPISQLFY